LEILNNHRARGIWSSELIQCPAESISVAVTNATTIFFAVLFFSLLKMPVNGFFGLFVRFAQ
jgi:hypothetical protein